MRFLCGLAAVFMLATSPAFAQRPNLDVPNQLYTTGFAPFYDGDFATAGKTFQESGSRSIKAGEARWVDNVCYHTMVGECYYRMGDMTEALDQYSSAIKHYLANRDWILRAELPATIDVQQQPKTVVTWGTSQRSFRLGQYNEKYSTLFGRLDNDVAVQKGGVVATPQLYPVNVVEIMRGFCQAIRRRREIMGPACEHDPLTAQLVEAIARRPGLPNHWSQCWISLALGLSYHSANKPEQATSEITQSLLAGGAFEHPLSAMGMLELGKIAFEKKEYPAAGTYFLEATYSAALYEQYDVLEEAFVWGATTWSVLGKQGPFPPLANAITWTQQKKLRVANVTLLTLAAEGMLDKGDIAPATKAISQAKAALARSEMNLGDVGARFNFTAALAAYQNGQLETGNTAMAAALKWQSGGSKRLFQIGLVDALAVSGQITERVADLLYADTLREPTANDWLIDPHDTLAVVGTPHPLPYEHWLEVALVRKETDKALNIADRLRRHRFFSTIPLGGRLTALRWILEAPEEALSGDAALDRQALLVKHPGLDKATRKAAELKAKLQQTAPDSKERVDTMQEWAKVVAVQELGIRYAALRREPSQFVFPPLRETKEVQQKLPPDTLVLAYISTSQRTYAFAMTKERLGVWPLENVAKVKTDLQEIYKSWGLHDRTQPVQAKDLENNNWKPAAERLAGLLTNNMKADDWAKYKELIVIPDRSLWHVPFEMLPAGKGAEEPLIAALPLRYAPTLGLAVPDGRAFRRSTKLGAAVGKISEREKDAGMKEAIEASLPADGIEKWETLVGPSQFTVQACDRLVVFADQDDAEKGYDWSPLALDRTKTDGQLADWLNLPWGGPTEVAFPGYRTAAESGLKKGGTGDEIFLTLCALMSDGPRTVLLSRWRVSGQSSLDLVREYHQELGHSPADVAWRRSVRLLREAELALPHEPRVKGSRETIKGEHPFFWAGYILCDTGTQPTAAK